MQRRNLFAKCHAPGERHIKIGLLRSLHPISFICRDYCVTSTSIITSFGVEPSTAFANDSIESFNDRLALVGDALALKSLGLCFRFGLLLSDFFPPRRAPSPPPARAARC
jgi:hypothetical protein